MPQPLRAALVLLVLAPSARGQEIGEEEFVGVFGAEHAASRSLEEGLARAEAARRRAGVLANPRVDIWQERPEGSPRVTNWTLAWTPPFDGRLGLSRRAADARVRTARERLAADTARLRSEVRRVFAAWSLALEREALARRQHDRVRGLASRERERARIGEGSGLSARRLGLAEGEARAAAGEAEAERARAEAMARAWRPDLPSAARPARVFLPELPPDLNGQDPPEVRALRFEAEEARLRERLGRRFWAFPELQLGWQSLRHGGVGQGGPILAGSWSVPLLDRAQAARVETARQRDIAEARLALAAAHVKAEIEGRQAAYAALLSAARETEQAPAEADRVVEAAAAVFQAGESTLTDLLETLRSASEARVRGLELRSRAHEAHRELEAAVGRPLSP